jgi:hypothetical protein
VGNLTREQILARKIGKGKATLPDGGVVSIRALTRDEVLASQEIEDTGERENFLIAMGMTDPKLSREDVSAWAAGAAAGDVVAVSDAIAILSGLKQGAGKSSVDGSGG